MGASRVEYAFAFAQVGRCHSLPGSEKLADAIDGADGSWSLPLAQDDGTLLEPVSTLGYTEEEVMACRAC